MDTWADVGIERKRFFYRQQKKFIAELVLDLELKVSKGIRPLNESE